MIPRLRTIGHIVYNILKENNLPYNLSVSKVYETEAFFINFIIGPYTETVSVPFKKIPVIKKKRICFFERITFAVCKDLEQNLKHPIESS